MQLDIEIRAIIVKRCFSRLLIPFNLATPQSPDQWFESALGDKSDNGWLGAEADETSFRAYHSSYVVFYHEHVKKFLFDGHGRTGCRYLRKNDPMIESDRTFDVWLGTQKSAIDTNARNDRPSRRGLAHLSGSDWLSKPPFENESKRLQLTLQFGAQPIELWFSGLGIGVLSVAIEINNGDQELTESDVLKLHHELATAESSVWLRDQEKQDAGFDFHKFVSQQMKIFESSSQPIEFADRGRIFSSLEFKKEANHDVYSSDIQQTLSHVAQLHPPSHPGEHPSHMFSELLVINHEHVCRFSSSGVAHATMVDDQIEYSRDRSKNIQSVYFLGYLLALIQESALNQILIRSTGKLGTRPIESLTDEVFADVVHFDMEGEFAQVSSKGPIQKHHEIAQQSVNLQAEFGSIQRAISNFQHTIENQKNSKSEHAMHGLHVFIVSVYSLELAHVLASAFDVTHGWFLGVSLVLVVITTFALAVQFVSTGTRSKKGFKDRLITLFLWFALIHVIFLTANIVNTSLTSSQSDGTEQTDGH